MELIREAKNLAPTEKPEPPALKSPGQETVPAKLMTSNIDVLYVRAGSWIRAPHLAHMRRHLFNAIFSFPSESCLIQGKIWELYLVEREIQGELPEKKAAASQQKSLPMLEESTGQRAFRRLRLARSNSKKAL